VEERLVHNISEVEPAYTEVELAIGDVLLLGNKLLRVVDIDGDLVCFRVESGDSSAHEFEPVRNSVGYDGLDRPSWPR